MGKPKCLNIDKVHMELYGVGQREASLFVAVKFIELLANGRVDADNPLEAIAETARMAKEQCEESLNRLHKTD